MTYEVYKLTTNDITIWLRADVFRAWAREKGVSNREVRLAELQCCCNHLGLKVTLRDWELLDEPEVAASAG